MPTKKTAAMFVSRRSDAAIYAQALRRVRCNDPRRIHSLDEISTEHPCNYAIVEVFEHRWAVSGKNHVADDQSASIRVLKRIRQCWPDCVVLGISHATCINGSSYAEGKRLVDGILAVDWSLNVHNNEHASLDGVENALKRAARVHLIRKKEQPRDADVAQDAQPAA